MKSGRIVYLSLLFALAAVLLSGCLQVSVGIGIDEVHNSYLSYDISMNVSDVDPQYHEILESALNNFGWMYQENYGFTASFNTDADNYTLTMRKTAHNDSFPEAFDSLKAMLTDESITVFSTVQMATEGFPRQDSFIIEAMLDIPRMIELSSAGELPPELLAELDKALETSGGAITLTVPVSEIADSSHDTETYGQMAKMTIPFDFTGQTEFEFRGSIVYSHSGAQSGAVEDTVLELDQLKTLVMIASASALVLLFIILLAVLLRRRRDYW